MKNACFIITMILLLASCGGRSKSADIIESAAEGDTIAVVTEIPAGVQEGIDSEPVIRIDTITEAEIRETLLIAMTQDSAPEYYFGKYSHLRQMPDSIQNIIISRKLLDHPHYREFTSTPEWECEIDRVSDSDKLAYLDLPYETIYYFADKFVINVTNKNTQNNIYREITRDYAVPDSLCSIKKGFKALECFIENISPDTVKIYTSFLSAEGSIISKVYISISEDGNFSINKKTNSMNDEDDWY